MMSATTTTESKLVALPAGARVKDVAEACRSAALGFAWGALAWGRRDLARWLSGPYAAAIDPTRASHTPPPSARISGIHARHVAEDEIGSVLINAHAGLIDTLKSAWTACHEGSLSTTMIDLGLVTPVMDEEFSIGYAPVDFARLRLVDRVTSLFVADFLTRPREYEAFSVCTECGAVTYDWYEHVTECEDEATPATSQIRLERRVETLDFGAVDVVFDAVG